MANKNALRLFDLGFTPVLLGGEFTDLMRPQLIGWETATFARASFGWWPAKNNVGIRCGYQSSNRNLTVFKFDKEYRSIFPEWCERANQWVHQPLVTVSNGRGLHVYFYTDEPYPGHLLAGRYARSTRGYSWLVTFIETLGIGQFVGSVGSKNYNGRRLYFTNGAGYEDIPTLSSVQYKNLITISKSFDKRPTEPANKPLKRSQKPNGSRTDDYSDCLDYARQAIGGVEKMKWNGDIFFLKYAGFFIAANGCGWYSYSEETGGGLSELIVWHRELIEEGIC